MVTTWGCCGEAVPMHEVCCQEQALLSAEGPTAGIGYPADHIDRIL